MMPQPSKIIWIGVPELFFFCDFFGSIRIIQRLFIRSRLYFQVESTHHWLMPDLMIWSKIFQVYLIQDKVVFVFKHSIYIL